ncbi:MAG: phage head closure protein [Cucumibacter sp.]
MNEKPPPLGTLRERVGIFSKQTSIDAEGGHDVSFVPLGLAWARVSATVARDRIGDGVATAITHTVVLRHRTDIAPGDRIVWGGRTLEVIGAEDLNGRRAYLVCRCLETVIAG